MDFEQTWFPNVITSTVIENVRIPMVMKNDREAIQVCLRTCTDNDKKNPRDRADRQFHGDRAHLSVGELL